MERNKVYNKGKRDNRYESDSIRLMEVRSSGS